MSKRGNPILDAYRQQLVDERLAQHTTTRCVFCPDWTATGTLAETREAARAHRVEQHPELRERKHKSRPGQLMVSRKTVGENIAAVREQGGATWEGAA